ncbi:hypothetical protein [Caulobacter phage Cr30]|uniref:hypothetical protein n=1 Tax=Caulobacter phage Cr30 TaxID=1357714 RepID=UPI0004A9B800|nr:hypothetical protein OZ74_gp111 [Caulobacter phage Cr30]AGS80996.1 hypothetical protein [Caulobacter phage Cr30]
MSVFKEALTHSLNYHSIDAKCNVPDYELAELLHDEFVKYLLGTTDVQVYEKMSPEERSRIGI